MKQLSPNPLRRTLFLGLLLGALGCGAEGGAPGAGGGSGLVVTPGVNPYPMQTLPFALDDVFSPSGYEGDGSVVPSSTVMTPHAPGDTQTCRGARSSATAQGHCHIASYDSSVASSNPKHVGWAGVYWQAPSNNWGTIPGANIAPGATEIHFLARGQMGGEVVTFGAGGISSPTGSYGDSFAVSNLYTLTTDWQEYSLPLDTAQYGYAGNGVLGGFYWSASTGETFFIDDIVWR